MSDKKFYYICDFANQRVQQFIEEIPPVWGQISGMQDLSDEALKDLTWAGYPGMGFIPESQIHNYAVDAYTRDEAKRTANLLRRDTVIVDRDRRLAYSDRFVGSDRWEQFTMAQRAEITQYRQKLRDLTQVTEDWFNPVWPTMPGFVT